MFGDIWRQGKVIKSNISLNLWSAKASASVGAKHFHIEINFL